MKFLLTVMVLLIIGCATKPKLDEAKAKIRKQNEKLHKVVATKNTNLLKEVYAEDAYFLAPGLGPVRGRDSIIALWSDGLENVLEMHSESIMIDGTIDVMYEVGIVENKIRYHNPDSTVLHRAKYNNVWKLDSAGEYRLTVDIWNKME
ncbi:nuclear transport factor 2 family protein [bacterium]|nr:nuclear transport factor 2 family protein [bacterium]